MVASKGAALVVAGVVSWLLVVSGAVDTFVVSKPPKALSQGTWVWEDKGVSGSQWEQYVYTSPMGKTCRRNLTIHTAAWFCSSPVGGAAYSATRECLPHGLEMSAYLVDKINADTSTLQDTCLQLSAYNYDYFLEPLDRFTQEVVDATVQTMRLPRKHAIVSGVHWAQAIALAKGAKLSGVPMIHGYMWAFGFASNFADMDTFHRAQADVAASLDGVMDQLPQKFAVLYDFGTASGADPRIREAAARKGKTIGLSAVIPTFTHAAPTLQDVPTEQFIDSMVALQLRYLLLATNPEPSHAVFACKLYKKGLHKDIQVFTLLGLPLFAAYFLPTLPHLHEDCPPPSQEGNAVTQEGGWIGLTYLQPMADSDIVINQNTGSQGRAEAGPYGLDGQPWDSGNGLVVAPTDGCRDDEAAVSESKALMAILAKSPGETITCAEVAPFGQSRQQPYVVEIAQVCPVTACAFNRWATACRISCACRDASLTYPDGSKLCVGVEEIPADHGYDGSGGRHYRCEGKQCRPLAFDSSAWHYLSRFGDYYFSGVDGFCSGELYGTGCEIVGAGSAFIYSQPGIVDGIYGHAEAFRCIERRHGETGLQRVADNDYTDAWVKDELLSCLRTEVIFEGLTGRVSFKEENYYASAPGSNWMALAQAMLHSKPVRRYIGSGFMRAEGAVVSNRVFRRRNYLECVYWKGVIGPGSTCPPEDVLEYTLKEDNKEVMPIGEPAICPAGQYSPAIQEGSEESCIPCLPGTYKEQESRARCLPCPPGMMSESGQEQCDLCPAGKAADTPRQPLELLGGIVQSFGAQGCSNCSAGTASGRGALVCKSCATGFFTDLEGSSECAFCPKGTYSDSEGVSLCTPCSSGLSTINIGSRKADECVCGENFYKPSASASSCLACMQGLECPAGSLETNIPQGIVPYPMVKPGYYTLSSAPHSVYRCLEQDACPGGMPESCSGKLLGMACGQCAEGYYTTSEGSCKKCAGTIPFAALVVLALLVGPPVMVLSARFTDCDIGTWNLQSNVISSLLLLALVFGQIFAVHSRLKLTLPFVITDNAVSLNYFVDPEFLFKFACIGFPGYADRFYVKMILPVGLAVVVVLAGILGKLANTRRPGFAAPWYTFCNLYGACFNTLYLAIAQVCLTTFICYEHPNKESSLRSASYILCGSEEWAGLAAVSVIAVLVYCVATLAVAVVALCCASKYFSRAPFRMGFKFLFFKFRTGYGWWTIALLVKSLWVTLAPVVFLTGPGQILWLNAGLLAYVMAVVLAGPWRFRATMICDLLIHALLVLILNTSCLFVDDEDLQPHEFGVAVTMMMALGFTVIGAFILHQGYLVWRDHPWRQGAQPLGEGKGSDRAAEIATACRTLAGQRGSLRQLLPLLPEKEVAALMEVTKITQRELGKQPGGILAGTITPILQEVSEVSWKELVV